VAVAITVGEWIASAARTLSRARLVYGHGTHNSRDEAVWLIVHVARLSFEGLDGQLERVLSAPELRRAGRLLEQRIATRKPLAYLLKEAWLRDRLFYVDERVIVPRSFIAELLPEGLKPWLSRPRSVKHVLDMCTGSGCLAIIAAQSYPAAHVTGVDISTGALAVARKNVARFNLDERIQLVRSDLFARVDGAKFDLIVSNPPYVTSGDMRRLPAEYRHEPDIALAGGRDGLDAVDVLLRDAARFLKPRGVLVVEIGHNRRALERRYPRMAFTWPTTSAGDDMLFLLTREQLVEREGKWGG
jgi:ribosomal protein L3 glutamine methyltransferase